MLCCAFIATVWALPLPENKLPATGVEGIEKFYPLFS